MRLFTCLAILMMLVALPGIGLAAEAGGGMPIEVQKELWQLVPTVAYFLVGLVLFGLSIVLMEKVTPFSIRKEIEEDQNISLGILMGCVLIGLAIIMAAAMK